MSGKALTEGIEEHRIEGVPVKVYKRGKQSPTLGSFGEAMILRDLGVRERVKTSGFLYEKAPILKAL
jgi:hypothetical protein